MGAKIEFIGLLGALFCRELINIYYLGVSLTLNTMDEVFSDLITSLPEADMPFKGIRAWLSQGRDHQIIFFEIEPIGKVPEHAHGAQWGVVLEGELTLTINGISGTYRKGDRYYIPAGMIHSAECLVKTYAIDFFADKDRYRVKTE